MAAKYYTEFQNSRRLALARERIILQDWTSLPPVEAIREIAADDVDYTVTKMCMPRGRGPSPHHHPHKQVIVILEGSGVLQCGKTTSEFHADSVFQIPPDVPHTFLYVSEKTRWLEFFTPGREDFR